ncbi:hypothetical protein BpHYR1_048748 [Brachionus plicatilis]|uniref:Uncharacterized protein n=1 Tax=Brachionus plicatilis TaxID=10195 RepID=A0A3M7Q024_BRAPC|nr:hypothetical protein BpHYR1_048748 [Brachionus plicatilis]
MRKKNKKLSSFLVIKNCFISFILSIASFELITCLFASCCSSISVSLSCSTLSLSSYHQSILSLRYRAIYSMVFGHQ